MSKGHGQRKYLQILLETHRGELFFEMAEETGAKASALARDILYEFIEEHTEKKKYKEAKDLDENAWKKSVQNRLEGRALSKLIKSIRRSS
tara:strand:+ start:18 stop:290 length:273 start_codon:yes stop_codon:yes gene_type:complete